MGHLMLQVSLLETLRIAPKGSSRVSNFLIRAADGLVQGGRFVSLPFLVPVPTQL